MVTDRFLREVVGLRSSAVILYGPAIRLSIAAVLGLSLAALAGAYWGLVRDGIRSGQYQDFQRFFASAVNLADGRPLYEDSAGPGNLNPPLLAIVMLPLTVVGVAAAYEIWSAISVASLLVSLWLVQRTLGLSRTHTAVMGVLVLASAPVIANLQAGQVAGLLLLPFTLAWRDAHRQREVTTGAWMALCASLKPFLLLFLAYFVVTRQRTAVRSFVVTIVVLSCVSLAVAGPAAHLAWAHRLMGVRWEEHYWNASLLGLVSRSVSTGEWQYVPALRLESVVLPLWVGLVASLLGATLLELRHAMRGDRAWLATTAAAILASPLGWVYYVLLCCGPLAGLLRPARAPASCLMWLTLVATLGLLVPPAVASRLVQTDLGIATATLGSVYCWSLVGIWVGSVFPSRWRGAWR